MARNIKGSILDYEKITPGTLRTSAWLTTERRTMPSLRKITFSIADGLLYRMDGDMTFLAVTTEEQNPLFNHPERAREKIKSGLYFPDPEQAKESFYHPTTLLVNLDELEQGYTSDTNANFEINSSYPCSRLPANRNLAQRLIGPDEENFELNFEDLNQRDTCPTVSLLRTDYVREVLRKNGKEFLCTVGSLRNDINGSMIDIGDSCGWKDGIYRAEPRLVAPTFQEMVKLSQKYVPEGDMGKFRKALKGAYQP